MVEPTLNQYAPPRAHVADALPDEAVGELNFFSAEGRIGRLRYLAYATGASFVHNIAVSAMTVALGDSMVLKGVAVAAFIALIWFNFLCAIKRCHDMDISTPLRRPAGALLIGPYFRNWRVNTPVPRVSVRNSLR